MKRSEAEAIYAAGRDAVVDELLRLDRRIDELDRRLLADDRGAAALELRLPERLEEITLVLPAGDRLPARVSERGGDALTLVVAIPIAPFREQQLAAIVIEVALLDGRARLHGRLSCPDPSAPEVLRLEEPSVVDFVQQREFARAVVACPVHLIVAGGEGPTIRTHTINLGGSGALLDGPHALEVGTAVEFEIAVDPGAPPVRGSGHVIRKDEQEHPAIGFDSIDPVDRQRLLRLVSESRLAEGFGPG